MGPIHEIRPISIESQEVRKTPVSLAPQSQTPPHVSCLLQREAGTERRTLNARTLVRQSVAPRDARLLLINAATCICPRLTAPSVRFELNPHAAGARYLACSYDSVPLTGFIDPLRGSFIVRRMEGTACRTIALGRTLQSYRAVPVTARNAGKHANSFSSNTFA